ncbi:hypothetical protein [Mycobacterium sp. E740]|uniref:hypothetical protein n=1 Tax=Mycobacterium sp. E740 TaxID=1834149 RepID=UPI0007FBAF71|nr:hypothetical protein [Mycobacterium sp. E740]OBI78449.1 hypothetical protein A5663_20330 [Mycobacterium sp. E740]
MNQKIAESTTLTAIGARPIPEYRGVRRALGNQPALQGTRIHSQQTRDAPDHGLRRSEAFGNGRAHA